MKSKTYKIVDNLLLQYETGKKINKYIDVLEAIGLQEEGGIIFGGLKVQYNNNNNCYLIHFKIGNCWAYPSGSDIKEIENILLNIINEKLKNIK